MMQSTLGPRTAKEQNTRDYSYILICTQNIPHQVCTIWVILHLMQNLVYLVQLHHCITPGWSLYARLRV